MHRIPRNVDVYLSRLDAGGRDSHTVAIATTIIEEEASRRSSECRIVADAILAVRPSDDNSMHRHGGRGSSSTQDLSIRLGGPEGRARRWGQVEAKGRGQAAPAYREARDAPLVDVLFPFSGSAFWDQTSYISLARRNSQENHIVPKAAQGREELRCKSQLLG